jgi:hypothetical protein
MSFHFVALYHTTFYISFNKTLLLSINGSNAIFLRFLCLGHGDPGYLWILTPALGRAEVLQVQAPGEKEATPSRSQQVWLYASSTV